MLTEKKFQLTTKNSPGKNAAHFKGPNQIYKNWGLFRKIHENEKLFQI
jgi:hypothetical protein